MVFIRHISCRLLFMGLRLRKFGRLVPLWVVRQRYLKKRFGKFRRLRGDGSKGKGASEEGR